MPIGVPGGYYPGSEYVSQFTPSAITPSFMLQNAALQQKVGQQMFDTAGSMDLSLPHLEINPASAAWAREHTDSLRQRRDAVAKGLLDGEDRKTLLGSLMDVRSEFSKVASSDKARQEAMRKYRFDTLTKKLQESKAADAPQAFRALVNRASNPDNVDTFDNFVVLEDDIKPTEIFHKMTQQLKEGMTIMGEDGSNIILQYGPQGNLIGYEHGRTNETLPKAKVLKALEQQIIANPDLRNYVAWRGQIDPEKGAAEARQELSGLAAGLAEGVAYNKERPGTLKTFDTDGGSGSMDIEQINDMYDMVTRTRRTPNISSASPAKRFYESNPNPQKTIKTFETQLDNVFKEHVKPEFLGNQNIYDFTVQNAEGVITSIKDIPEEQIIVPEGEADPVKYIKDKKYEMSLALSNLVNAKNLEQKVANNVAEQLISDRRITPQEGKQDVKEYFEAEEVLKREYFQEEEGDAITKELSTTSPVNQWVDGFVSYLNASDRAIDYTGFGEYRKPVTEQDVVKKELEDFLNINRDYKGTIEQSTIQEVFAQSGDPYLANNNISLEDKKTYVKNQVEKMASKKAEKALQSDNKYKKTGELIDKERERLSQENLRSVNLINLETQLNDLNMSKDQKDFFFNNEKGRSLLKAMDTSRKYAERGKEFAGTVLQESTGIYDAQGNMLIYNNTENVLIDPEKNESPLKTADIDGIEYAGTGFINSEIGTASAWNIKGKDGSDIRQIYVQDKDSEEIFLNAINIREGERKVFQDIETNIADKGQLLGYPLGQSNTGDAVYVDIIRTGDNSTDTDRFMFRPYGVDGQGQKYDILDKDGRKVTQTNLSMEEVAEKIYSSQKARFAHSNNISPEDVDELSKWTKVGITEDQKKKNKEIIETLYRNSGEDPYLGLAIASMESNFDHRAKAGTSSAQGLFQFVTKTAQSVGLVNPADPAENTQGSITLLKANRDTLANAGIKDTNLNLYLAHQQGASKAIELLNKPEVPVLDILSRGQLFNNLTPADKQKLFGSPMPSEEVIKNVRAGDFVNLINDKFAIHQKLFYK